jgi:hypothetical protein
MLNARFRAVKEGKISEVTGFISELVSSIHALLSLAMQQINLILLPKENPK